MHRYKARVIALSANLSAASGCAWVRGSRGGHFPGSMPREFYQAEALRGGWPIRQLNRQIESQFYERTSLKGQVKNASP
jgi:hypothetical protein